jgi:ATP-dependent RNA helicase DeaD
MLQGEDLVGQAQTGTGKTAAFGIPLAETLDPEQRHVQSVVLTPTRELAIQVSEELRSLCRYRGLRVATVYGGQSINRQIDALQNGVHIVVGTPGRMLDHLGRRTLRLDRVRTAVLDEADEMLDIGFADDIERILRFTPSSRQTALFSATMPKAIHHMVYRHLKHPTWVRIGGEAEPVEQVRQVYYEVASRDKNAGLEELLENGDSTGLDHGGAGQTLIFRRTQRGVERLVNYLRRRGASVRGIHGRLSQGQRDAVMSAFRAGRLELLVATNLAARGLDIPAISRVINFDTPQNVEEYVHRIGRTSRMGRPGTAITFVGESEFDDFEPIQRHLGADLKQGRLALYS